MCGRLSFLCAERMRSASVSIPASDGVMLVCQLYAKKNSQRKNVKRNTEKGRQYLMKILENDPLGARSIDTVKLSDGKEWAMRMYENGFSYKTISNYKRSLKASFYMAIEDDCIRKNPFNFKLSDVLEDNSEPKVILTPEQEEKMLAFMEQDKTYSKYYDEVVILLETGLRISEFCGQHIMGHSNITMTLGYYAHGTFNSAKAELERLALAS